MSRRRGVRGHGTVVVATAATVALTAVGMWARAHLPPLWPTVLTDWSLGAALLALSSAGVGAVIAVRVPRHTVGRLFVTIGCLSSAVLAGRWVAAVGFSEGAQPAVAVWAAWLMNGLIPLNMTLLSLLLIVFPHGTMPSRRWRAIAAAVVVCGIATAVAHTLAPYVPGQTPFAAARNPTAVLDPSVGKPLVDWTATLVLVGFITGAASLVIRLRRSRGVQRQQLKWFCFSAVVTVVTYVGGIWIDALFVVATLVAFPAVPIAAGVAVLRYRLYDIDRVINRTVVYAAVTGVLAVAYLVAVAGMRALITPVTGDAAPAVAASTLAVAALFRPVRTRIQSAVDRRFNRARYDAAATVEDLRLRFRDEVDLESLRGELLATVYATMQPAGTTLWLREAER